MQECRRAQRRAREEIQETESVLKEASDKAGFQSLDECKEWYKKKDTEESVRKTLEQYRADRKSTEERIKAEEQETAGKERPDMLALNEKSKALQDQLKKPPKGQPLSRNAQKRSKRPFQTPEPSRRNWKTSARRKAL